MNKYTWEGAFKAIEKLNKYNYNGHDDWRMPNIEELFSIIDYTKTNPASKLSDMLAASYWSSTTDAVSTSLAWYVSFGYGYVSNGNKTNYFYVRAVRSGPNGLRWSHTL